MKKSIYLIVLAGLAISSCGKDPQGAQQGQQAVQVSTTQVSGSPTVFYDTYPGTVKALQKVELRSEVSGYIRDITFEEGEEVKKGQRLYLIDQSKYLAAKNQANARLKVAQSNLNLASQDAKRYIALGEKDAIATQQVDIAKTNLENARQQVSAAQADLERAQTDLNYSAIKAPFDGMIGISEVRLGAYVAQGQTLLNTISSFNPIGVDFEVTETEITRYSALKKSESVVADSIFYLTLPGGQTYGQPGEIAIIDRGVNSQTGTIKVRLSFSNPDEVLRDGLSVTVHVKNNSSGHNLIIPHKAVMEQMGEFFVFTVRDGKAMQERVMTGKQIGDQIVIKSGIKEGDTIVTEGIQRLRNGMAVTTADNRKSQSPAATK